MFSFGRKSKTPDEPAKPAPKAATVDAPPSPKPAPPAPSPKPAPAPAPIKEAPKPEPAPSPAPVTPSIPTTPPLKATTPPAPTPDKPAVSAPVPLVSKMPTSDLTARRRRRQIQSLYKSLSASRKHTQLLRRRFIQPNVRPVSSPAENADEEPMANTPVPDANSRETIDHAAELAKAPAFAEMQHEIASLRDEVDLLRAASKKEVEVPALDAEAVKLAVPTAPAFVQLQSEAAHLRGQVDTLKKELAKVRKIFSAFGQDDD